MNKKDQKRAERAIEKGAMKEGISVSEFRKGLEEAIEVGWNNEDPQIKRYWLRVANGIKPSAEEFILFVAEEAKKKRLH
ncbi:MAG: hypothetical protein IKV45_02590 [Firmicutes bacterium]|nr:hypothetical protein [Bacillota bacterium]